MRWTLLLALLLTAFAGCSDDAGGAGDGNGSGGGSGGGGSGTGEGGDGEGSGGGSPPAAIHEEGMLFGANGAPYDQVGCLQTNCASVPFTLKGRFAADIVLTPNQVVADYDIYLLDGKGKELASSTNAAGVVDQIKKTLPAGDYTVEIRAWQDAGTGYAIDITFANP